MATPDTFVDWKPIHNSRRGITGYPTNLRMGRIYSLDNRRVETYILAGREEIPVWWVKNEQVRDEGWKITTKNQGEAVKLELKLGRGYDPQKPNGLGQYIEYLQMCGLFPRK